MLAAAAAAAAVVLAALALPTVSVHGQVFRPRTVEKSVVNYLGNNFLLLDGCPEPECLAGQADCERTVATIRNLYSACLQSEKGQHLGCVTNRLSDKEIITLPKYNDFCLQT